MVVRDNGQGAKAVSGCKYYTRNTELPMPMLDTVCKPYNSSFDPWMV
jgi:hypothetical protein